MERVVCGKGLVEPLEGQTDGVDGDDEEIQLDRELLVLDIKKLLDNCAAKSGESCSPADCPAARLYEIYTDGKDEGDEE